MMNISNFDDLVRAARSEPQPQRVLFVFARAEMPDDSTPEQRARFEAGHGGALTPLMSVDKTPDELGTFGALMEESRQFAPDWAIVFVTTLSGHDGQAPTPKDADRALQVMIESIKAGSIGAYLPFDTDGQPVLLN